MPSPTKSERELRKGEAIIYERLATRGITFQFECEAGLFDVEALACERSISVKGVPQ